MSKLDIAIINTKLLTFRGNNLGIVDNGGLGIVDGEISYSGSMSGFNYKDADKIIDGKNHVTMPGLVNAHIHTGSTILRGGAQDLPEIEWMNKGIGPIARNMTPEDLIVGSKLGVLEGLKSGTTTFCEYAGNVANLVNEVYLPFKTRVVASETINEVSTNRAHLKPADLYEFDRSKGEQAFKRASNLFKQFENKELVSCSYGPQALDMISLELLNSIYDEAKLRNSFLHIHVAQGERERLQIIGRYGKEASTVKVLEQNKLLDENMLAAHCHDTTTNERELLVKRGVKMVGCPSSISMIDGIVPPIGHFFSLGGKVGIGSDQAPGPGLHNMFCEMRTISILTKTMKTDPTILPAWDVIQIGTKGGAMVLGLNEILGSLEVGKRADVITVDLSSPNLTPVVTKPFRNYIPNLIYSATGYEIDNVIINGQSIISEKEFVTINEKKIIKEANIRAKRIFEDAAEDWIKANSQMVNYMKKGFL
ncbi:MAG: amidohydrolase family protein [Asgard group archaeon]|nr:amidohydrolase family protein [Asgard group archaeon]